MIQAAEQLAESVSVSAACQALGVPRSSLYRARQPKKARQPRPTPERALSPWASGPRALSQEEKDQVRQVLNSERFQDSVPRQVYATLLDEGEYLCHWRTMYRILDEHGEIRERRNQLQHSVGMAMKEKRLKTQFVVCVKDDAQPDKTSL